MITSAVALPQRLSLALGLPTTGTLSIPAFSRDEITEFLIARGCPGAPVASWWAAFVELHTSGHAQLVHARILGHESIATTRLYAETTAAMLQRRFDQLTDPTAHVLISGIRQREGDETALLADLLA